MPVRDIISIDEDLCDGCGLCVSACAEGAIQIIDGKAKLVSETYCDGLGACLGDCPTGALTVVQREASVFDEAAVAAHLSRLQESRRPAPLPTLAGPGVAVGTGGGCPGSRSRVMAVGPVPEPGASQERSQLRHWPVQLHLVPPTAPFFQGADVLLAADCVAYAAGGFHTRFLHGSSLAIACPKLDSHQEIYVDKLAAMIDQAGVASLRVMVMEVPCCGGLVRLVQTALARASRAVPVTVTVVGVQGDVLAERELTQGGLEGVGG